MKHKLDIRKFGIVAFLFFGTLCAIAVLRDKEYIRYFFGTLSLLGLLFILLPNLMRPVYDGWLKITHFIGKTITAIMMSLAYFLIITPTALIKRILGRRPIKIKPDKNAPTYWVTRTEPAQPKERFIKRY
jgi:hypothetical protein